MVFFFFYVLNVFSHSLLAYKIFYEKSTDSLIGVSLYMTSHFSLASFKILSLSLTYENLIIVCFVDGLFVFSLLEFFGIHGFGCSSTSPDLGNLLSLFFKINFLTLSVFLLRL